MTDTEILDNLLSAIDTLARIKFPASPKLLSEWVSWVAAERGERRVPDRNKQGVANPTFQHFWRCNHHPEAISNWAHGKGWHCKQGCDQRELKWCDNGVHPCDTETSSYATAGATSGSVSARTWDYGSGGGGQLSTSSASAGGTSIYEPQACTVPRGTIDQATVAEATVSHLTGVCEWVLAKQPKEGIHPQAFSWWDCAGRRRYGYPSRMICDGCGRELRLVSDGCKPQT